PRRDLGLPAGHRHGGDHRHRPRAASSHDPRQQRPRLNARLRSPRRRASEPGWRALLLPDKAQVRRARGSALPRSPLIDKKQRAASIANLDGTTIVCVEAEGSGLAAVTDERVLAGRAAFERHAFGETCELLSAVDSEGALSAADL